MEYFGTTEELQNAIPSNFNNFVNKTNKALTNVGDIVDNINKIGRKWDAIGDPTVGDTLADINLSAPGSSTVTESNPFYDVTGQYTPGIVAAAADIYNEGPPDLNPLQVDAYNQVSPTASKQQDLADQSTNAALAFLDPDSPLNQRLGDRAAASAASPFGTAGTFGSSRSRLAANEAALDQYYDNLIKGIEAAGTAQGQLEVPIDLQDRYGSQFYDYEANAPSDHLRQFQDNIRFGSAIPGSRATVTQPSGADIYNASLGRELNRLGLEEAYKKAGVDPSKLQTSGPLQDVSSTIKTVGDTVSGVKDIYDTGKSLINIIKNW